MNYKEKIEEMLVEGFAAAPSRCWACEARTPKEEIAGKREQNLEHIGIIADSVTSLLEQAQRDAVEGFVGWCDIDQEAIYNHPHFMQDYADQYLNQIKEDLNPKEGE